MFGFQNKKPSSYFPSLFCSPKHHFLLFIYYLINLIYVFYSSEALNSKPWLTATVKESENNYFFLASFCVWLLSGSHGCLFSSNIFNYAFVKGYDLGFTSKYAKCTLILLQIFLRIQSFRIFFWFIFFGLPIVLDCLYLAKRSQ